jgi:hypothetical protein
VFVRMYSKFKDAVKILYCISSSCGGVLKLSFCLPISAISQLKSSHKVYMCTII